MSDIKYESNNKEIIEKCVAIVNKEVAVKSYKKTKLKTRLAIEDIIAARRLNESLTLSC